jgi:hypothetical protein
MARPKRSPIWKIEKEELAAKTKQVNSFSEILKHFHLNPVGGQMKILRKKLDQDKIDYSHIPRGVRSNCKRSFGPSKRLIPLEKVMVENSSYNRGHLKSRLLRDGLLKNECSICDQGPEWNGKPLVLILDHINGVNNDHRMDNLRIICRHCDSQLETFAGRNHKLKRA